MSWLKPRPTKIPRISHTHSVGAARRVSLPQRNRVGSVVRRFGIEQRDHLAGRRRRADGALTHNLHGGNFAAVDVFVGAIVRTQRGTFKRDPGEKTSRTR